LPNGNASQTLTVVANRDPRVCPQFDDKLKYKEPYCVIVHHFAINATVGSVTLDENAVIFRSTCQDGTATPSRTIVQRT